MENIAKALIKAQTELKNPEKNQQGYGYKYADLASIIDETKPVLQKHGLVVVQLAKTDPDGNVGVETILLHESGETLKSTLTLPVADMKQMTVTQSAGASLTYARRYALSAILGISADDDTDASEPKARTTAPKQETISTEPKPKATEEQIEGMEKRLKLILGKDANLDEWLKEKKTSRQWVTAKQAGYFISIMDKRINSQQ